MVAQFDHGIWENFVNIHEALGLCAGLAGEAKQTGQQDG